MAIAAGTIIAGRYEILEPVGQGGMATVFRARRLEDGAVVAVKVLHEHYAHDREFVERFQREARAAAALHHPHIVPVLESGTDGRIHYIVMEFVEGTDLKALLRRVGRLDPQQAARIAAQTCEALAYAHGLGIIHRDIKPQNILLTPDGAVKVTDFGIARAANSATITETGTVLGSVHYLSPEQAKGESVGPAADLYALGVVLYELLTGRLPFEGESPIAIALRHIHDPPPPPRRFRPDLPPRLEGIILRALAKSPQHRYRSAQEMQEDLEGRADHWRDLPTVVISPDARTVRMPAGGPRRSRRRRSLNPVVAALVLLLFAAGALVAGWQVISDYLSVAEVRVPDLRGKPFAQAQEELERLGLSIAVLRREYSDRYPMNAVVDQDPPAGQRVRTGRVVQVVLSQGPQLVEVPDVTHRPLEEARLLIAQARLRVGSVLEDYDDRIPKGVVVSQDPPAASQVRRASPVNLVVSKGPELVPVPNLVGLTLEEARGVLHRVGIALGRISYAPRDDVPPGIIAEQSPPAGTMMRKADRLSVLIATSPLPSPEPTLAPLAPTPTPQEQPSPPPGQEETPEPQGGVQAPEATATVEGDPKGEGRRVRVVVRLPPGDPQEVRIVVVDRRGVREVYRRPHHPLEQVVRVVQVFGYAIVQVYVGGHFTQEFRP
jgi:beta-lactam-binding protein with PASTA domain/tRNA A-37 threonylcarbamoyl transferase component Bud32